MLGLVPALCVCAQSPDVERPLPAGPFPRGVSRLEAGRTDIAEVYTMFGEPGEAEESVRGGAVWRYDDDEVLWPADDPMRPVVSADGSVVPREPSA